MTSDSCRGSKPRMFNCPIVFSRIQHDILYNDSHLYRRRREVRKNLFRISSIYLSRDMKLRQRNGYLRQHMHRLDHMIRDNTRYMVNNMILSHGGV